MENWKNLTKYCQKVEVRVSAHSAMLGVMTLFHWELLDGVIYSLLTLFQSWSRQFLKCG